MIETKTLYPTRDYAVFSGTFDENGQTTFDIDLTGLTIADAILVISSIAVPTQETFYETHSEVGKGWLNTGSWSGKYFMANYFRCYSSNPPDCFDGSTKIGPFEHYPGTPNYTGYTTWTEENTQFVNTSYTAIVNEYPETVEYNLNSSSWTEITDNLGSGTTSITIPASSFSQGTNALQFRESNDYSTRYEWKLYTDQGATPEEYNNSYAYDDFGNMSLFTDTENNTTVFTYDSHHLHLTSITDALNHTITASHDFSTGLLDSMTDAKGNTTSFEYDILGRVTKKVYPDLTELEAVYDDQNNIATIYDELDQKTVNSYDGLGRLIRTEKYLSPSEKITQTFSYNYFNRIETRTDPKGLIYLNEYDSKGRLVKAINPDLTFREMYYDDVSRVITAYDENGHRKEYHLDKVGNLSEVREYIDSVAFYLTQYTYDDQDNLISLTDANGNVTFYAYDSLFGLTEITYPDLTTETYSYDGVGDLTHTTDAAGTTTFTYDAARHLISIGYPDQSVVTFDYDENSNRARVTDPMGQTDYTFDERNRTLSETRTIQGVPYTVSFAYDAASRLVSTVYPDSSVVTYEYNSLNQLVAIPGYATFTYDANSLLETATYENGVITTYQYDNRNRTVSIGSQRDNTDLLLMNYQYDPVGNVIQSIFGRRLPDHQWVQSQETFDYDWLDRLVLAQGDYGILSYSYDPVGNRLSENDVTYIYNNMNELLSTSEGFYFAYNEKGSIVSKSTTAGNWSYSYDTRELLTQVEKDQQMVANYSYDGDGRRMTKTEWIESLQEYHTLVYVNSGANILYEKNVTTGSYATYVYGPTGRLAKNVNGMKDYYHVDRLGSTRLVTDEFGNTVTCISYGPFGESVSTDEEERYLYAGKEMDLVGLYYYGARYYDPELGRFVTRDAAEGNMQNPQSMNLYIYCLNNPVRYTDLLGFNGDEDEEEKAKKLVQEIFNYLNNLGLDTMELSLEEYFKDEKGNPLTVAEGLMKLIGDLGFEIVGEIEKKPEEVTLAGDNQETVDVLRMTVQFEGATVEIAMYDDKYLGKDGVYGYAPPDTNLVVLNVSKHQTVGELAATLCHEISHRVLEKKLLMTGRKAENIIHPIHVAYVSTFAAKARARCRVHDIRFPFTDDYINAHY
jgi:RHS repeat-associated protein